MNEEYVVGVGNSYDEHIETVAHAWVERCELLYDDPLGMIGKDSDSPETKAFVNFACELRDPSVTGRYFLRLGPEYSDADVWNAELDLEADDFDEIMGTYLADIEDEVDWICTRTIDEDEFDEVAEVI